MLLRTPSANPTESLLGYALRVSESNGYHTPWPVFLAAGFEQGEIVSAGFKLHKLAAILGCPQEQLAPISYRENDGKKEFRLLGHPLGGALVHSPLRLKKPALCPCCVEESGYIDAFWDLSAAIACPIHGTKALSDCPACGTPLTWFRPGLLKCKCGAHLNQQPTQPALQAEIELMRLLRAKLHRAEKPEISTPSLPIDELWPLPLQSILELLVAIGNQASKDHSDLSKNDRTEVIRLAALTFSNWPANFHEFLHRLDKQSNAGGITLRKRFENFYSSMFKNRKNAADFRFLREELIRFGTSEWGDGIVDYRMLDGLGKDQRFMSLKKLAELTAIDPRTLTSWAKKGKFNLKAINPGSQRRFIADAKNFSALVKAEGRIFQEREAAKQLQLPVSALRFLKGSRHYASIHTPSYKTGYHELDLKHFYQSLLAKCCLLETPPKEPVVTLAYVMQEFRFWSNEGKGEFIVAILEDEIENLGRLDNSISSILFRRSDVTRFAQDAREKSSSGAISLQEAGEHLSCNPQAIKALIRDGHLHAQPGPGRRRVSRKSVREFAASHVSLLAIARKHDSSATKLHRICISKQIRTLRIPHEKSGETIFIAPDRQAEIVTCLTESRPIERLTADQALSRYLISLKEKRELLPRRAGKPHLMAIASACNFERSAFYKNKAVSAMLESYQREEAALHLLTPSQLLAAFLAKLDSTGESLPYSGTHPNLRAISKLCGFDRNCFYNDPALCEMLNSHLTTNSHRQN